MPRLTDSITIRIEGQAIGEFYPAEKIAKLSLQLEKLLKTSAEVSLVDFDVLKPKVEILAGFPRRGSLLQAMQIAWNTANDLKDLAPAFLSVAPQMLSLLNDAIEFIKLELPKFSDTTPPTIVVDNTRGNVTINNGDTYYNNSTIIVAGPLAAPLLEMYGQLGDGIDTINLSDGIDSPAVKIDAKDRGIADIPRIKSAAKALARLADELIAQADKNLPANMEVVQSIANTPAKAVVDILSFDKVHRTGKLLVVTSDILRRKRYGFDLARRPETESTIMAMLQSRVRVSCRVLGSGRLELLQVESAIA